MKHPCLNINTEIVAWVNNYTPLFYVDVITNPFPNSNAGSVNRC